MKEKDVIALRHMYHNKALGLDGMSPLFFLNYWDIIGQAVTVAVVNALNSGIIPPNLNHTFITLISKKKLPEYVADLCPISLCNVLYKLMAKVLATQLKCILPKIISLTQSAFVLRRLISDNILGAFKIMHFLNHKQ